MRRVTAATLIACGLLLAGPAAIAAPDGPDARITNPDWAEKPSGEDLANFYPERAARKRLGGRATILCRVNLEGRLGDCSVVSEAPAGEGFGPATVKLASKFRMTPQTRDGVPVDGARVRIPVVYSPPPPMSFTVPDSARPLLLVAALVLAGGAILLLGLVIGAYRTFGQGRAG